MRSRTLGEGQPYPLGATPDQRGVNFAIFSANSEKVELCLFDSAGQRELTRHSLPERTGDIWHGYLPGGRPGLLYGYRVYGPYDPWNGHRFNANKLLIDPYARSLDRSFEWNDIHCGYIPGDSREDLSFDTRDNAALMPKCRVIDPTFSWSSDSGPLTPPANSVIYELHARGYTMLHPAIEKSMRGTMAALRQPEIISHLQSLGITAVEFLPLHPAATTRVLAHNRLHEYWGYNSINFFALDPRFLMNGEIDDFQKTVRAFHDAGIEVILDVVFNHTGEGDEFGPTLSFRGIDNASYYCLAEDRRRYVDFTGCRNTLNFEHPRVLQMVLDSLRYFVKEMHVDGFRFDLAVSLARKHHHFSQQAPFFDWVMQDPTLAQTKLIAEPWDLGPDGYQVGAFPPPWSEWNDKYRDGARKFWRGEPGVVGDLAFRLSGSSDIFGGRGRRPTASVNFITAHDGFTLEDLVTYERKRNLVNMEDNADGTDANYSWNCGVEGPTENREIVELRQRQKRNLMATLLLSQGIPMLLAGDEFGRTQHGNNNAYCQDNEIGWVDWTKLDKGRPFLAFVQKLIAFRAAHPVFRRNRFFHGDHIDGGGMRDIAWLSATGTEMMDEDWRKDDLHCLGVLYAIPPMEVAPADPERPVRHALLLLMNAENSAANFVLPETQPDKIWKCLLDTRSNEEPVNVRFNPGSAFPLAAHSLALLASEN